MSCQEWELRIAQDEDGPEVEAHLAGCPACRALAEELSANSEAMRGLGEEVMPPLVLPRRAPSHWRWAAAVAAMLVAGFGLWQASKPPRIPTETITVRVPLVEPPKAEPALPVIVQVRHSVPKRVHRPSWQVVGFSETMPDDDSAPVTQALVRRTTSDPDVVIYWLIDKNKREEVGE